MRNKMCEARESLEIGQSIGYDYENKSDKPLKTNIFSCFLEKHSKRSYYPQIPPLQKKSRFEQFSCAYPLILKKTL